MSHEARFLALNLTLPPPPKPVGLYRPLLIHQGLCYLSGHGPLLPEKRLITGRVGDTLTLQKGRLAARQCGLAILATLKAELGSLDRIHHLVKLLGMVNSAPSFTDHPKVIDGCSELFVQVFGPEHGLGVRSAVGLASLPANIAVEVEAVFALNPE